MELTNIHTFSSQTSSGQRKIIIYLLKNIVSIIWMNVLYLYHKDDIAKYLEEFGNKIDSITRLVYSSLEIMVLNPIYKTISIVRIHILKPFPNLIT